MPRTKKVTPEEVAAAYGDVPTPTDVIGGVDVIVHDETVEDVAQVQVNGRVGTLPDPTANCIHEVKDFKRAAYQSIYGTPVHCSNCGKLLRLGWVEVV